MSGDWIDHLLYDSNTRIINRTEVVNLKWTVFDFGATRAAVAGARAQEALSKAQEKDTLQKLVLDSAQQYFAVVDAQASLSAAETASRYAERSADTSERFYRAGVAPFSDLLQAKVAASQARLQEIAAKSALVKATGSLASTLGFSPDTNLRVEIPLAPEADGRFLSRMSEILSSAYRSNPTVVAAARAVESAQVDLRAAKVAFLPSVSIYGDVQPFYQRIPHPQAQVFGSGQIPLNNLDYQWVIGLRITVPIFDGFERYGRVKDAEAALAVAREKLSSTERQVSESIFEDIDQLRTATRSIREATLLVENSEEFYSVAAKRYENRVGTLVDVLNAQAKFTDAKATYIRTESQWRMARLNLLSAVGMLLDHESSVTEH